MENVSGQIKGKMKGLFKEILLTLKSLDYQVKVKLMNTKYYQVPQSRERLIYMGVRNDLYKEPSFPIPNTKILTVGGVLREIKPIVLKPLTKKEVGYWIKLKYGEKGDKVDPNGNWFGFRKLNPNKPAPTIIKSAGNGLCHWKEQRHFASNELAILCSFPYNFKFIGTENQRVDRMGNAVMPNMMKAIALNIKENILN